MSLLSSCHYTGGHLILWTYQSVLLVFHVVLLVFVVDQYAFVKCKVPLIVQLKTRATHFEHVSVHQRRSVGVHSSDDFADLLPALFFLRFLERHHGLVSKVATIMRLRCLQNFSFVLVLKVHWYTKLFVAVNCQALSPVRDVDMDSSVSWCSQLHYRSSFYTTGPDLVSFPNHNSAAPISNRFRSANRERPHWTWTEGCGFFSLGGW